METNRYTSMSEVREALKQRANTTAYYCQKCKIFWLATTQHVYDRFPSCPQCRKKRWVLIPVIPRIGE